MRLNRLVPALILFVSGPAFAQDWVEYTSKADFFTVNFPSEPKVQETTYRSEYGYDLPARVYSAASGNSRYSATVVDYSVVEKLATEKSKTCPQENVENCIGGANAGLGYWRMDETNGTAVADWSGRNHNGKILNNAAGSWVTDPERGTVYRATGTNSIEFGTIIPGMSLTNDFTWSLWIKSDETGTAAAADNNIVFGNRYKDLAGTDFNPREFVKFTPSNFEWHWNAAGENVDYTDFVVGTWTHHVVVKQANKLAYYRDGVLANGNTNTITGGPTNPQPLYLGGQGTAERWKGYADEVAIFDRALSATEVQQVFDLGKAGQPLAPQPLLLTSVTVDAANLTVTWTGGTPPFKIQTRQSLSAGNWADVGSPTNERTATVPRNGATGFVRIVGQ